MCSLVTSPHSHDVDSSNYIDLQYIAPVFRSCVDLQPVG